MDAIEIAADTGANLDGLDGFEAPRIFVPLGDVAHDRLADDDRRRWAALGSAATALTRRRRELDIRERRLAGPLEVIDERAPATPGQWHADADRGCDSQRQ